MPGTFFVSKIRSVSQVIANTVWLTFEGAIEALPGQFVMVWLPGIGEKPFSIASTDPLGLLVVDVGALSHALHQLMPGDPVWLKGPLGQGFNLEGEHILLVGGGYGAAPLLPLANRARAQGKSVNVCLGAQTGNGLLLARNFDELGCITNFATDDGSRGEKGLVTKIVEHFFQTTKIDMLYACGPVGMLSALAGLCAENQIGYQLSWEAHMRCGMGLCGSCEVPQVYDPALPVGWLACFDGPVFIRRFASAI
jgi:dihydroorotate dehydrogenase electron transfer subunit